ncbi:hypothetical protein J3A83DRAFT_4271479 [Scleroderma citrinum]
MYYVVSTSSRRLDSRHPTPAPDARSIIRIHFNVDRAETLSRKFVDMLQGESSLVFYKARNESKDVIGIATQI